MQIGLFDILIMAGFGLWILFPIGFYFSTRKLYNDTDQSDQFIKNHQDLIGKADIWDEKINDWEENAEIIPFPQSSTKAENKKAA